MTSEIKIDDILEFIEETNLSDGEMDSIQDEEKDFAILRNSANEVVFIAKCNIERYTKIKNIVISTQSFPQLNEDSPHYTTITLKDLDLEDPIEKQIVALSLSIICNAYANGDNLVSTLEKLYSFFGNKIASDNASKSEITGLMGELLAMLFLSPTIGESIDAWHENPNNAYDFNYPAIGRRVEVKSTLAATRSHTFSSNQISKRKIELAKDENLNIFICSVQLEISMDTEKQSGFYSISEVMSAYKQKVNITQYQKLERVVLETLSGDLSDYDKYCYKIKENGIRIYNLIDIPVPEYDATLITHIKWNVNLPESLGHSQVRLNLNQGN